jgi:flavin-dependent dehydrogenase
MWDAIVAGAGPAGAVAAYELARSGRRVLLADTVDPTSPKIGEALPGAAVRLLRAIELPVPGAGGPHTPIGGNLASWNSDQLVANDFIGDPDGPGWRLDRVRFDADLRAAALRAGASYRSARVTDLERNDTGWHIRFRNGGTETARWVVDATGRRAAIARRLGARRLRDAPLVGSLCERHIRDRLCAQSNRDRGRAARMVVRRTSTFGRGTCRLSYAST